jgi:DNA invertase Pin-like site-specific DNA recombinase
MEKVVGYIRVSHQEQKLHGISLDAQKDKLIEYVEKHNLKLVGWYADEGVSGRKLIKHRPELQRMLHDAHEGKFDRILFIKLDRFFRSVAEYHECMKYIEPVVWTATEEKYDLASANGRAFVNMKLTIAELEADQTGERINIVNEYKVKTGQALTGARSQIFGHTVKKVDGIKRVVKDPETQHIAEDIIEYFLTHHNKRQTVEYIRNKYGIEISYNTVSNMLVNTKLYGHYRGNDDYCEAYVDRVKFIKIQEALKSNVKQSATKRVYLFSTLCKCPSCGNVLVGKYSGGTHTRTAPSGKTYSYERDYHTYRCNNAYRDNLCKFKRQVNEDKIEKALLDNFDQYINEYFTEVQVTNNRADVDNEVVNKQINDVKLEMKNTTTAFRKNRMTEKEYDKEYEELEARLKELESHLEPHVERDLSAYTDLLKSGWRELYTALTKENKRAFWKNYIKYIELNVDGTVKQPIFF